MGGLFSYESKPMQALSFLGDVILLNILFLVSCIPLFTIGAAQASMYSACKVLLDKEDDSSPYRAYVKCFFNGFGTVTLAWLVMTVALALIIWAAVSAWKLGSYAWLVCISVGFVAVFRALVPAFHSRFGCKWWQLIRNTWFLLFAHPLRSIFCTALNWVPAVCFFFLRTYTFMAMMPVWGLLYFGTAFCFASAALKKPFKTLTDHFNETHGIKPAGETTDSTEALPEETEENEEVTA